MKSAFYKKWFKLLLLTTLCLSLFAFARRVENHRLLLITGCARSGTTYITKLLQQGGLRVGHERVRRNGLCSWDLAVNPEKGRWNVRRGQYQFAHIFHQVRHPLKTLSSVYHTEDADSWNYILKHIPEIHPKDSHLVKSAKYWYYWNLEAEKRAEWTYRIEDIVDLVDEFGERLGQSSLFTWDRCVDLWDQVGNQIARRLDKEALRRVAKDTNTKGKHPDFTWDDLQKELDPELYDNLRALAVRYGYSLE